MERAAEGRGRAEGRRTRGGGPGRGRRPHRAPAPPAPPPRQPPHQTPPRLRPPGPPNALRPVPALTILAPPRSYPLSRRTRPPSSRLSPALPLPRSPPGDVVSLSGSRTRSPSEPRGAPEGRDTALPHGLLGLVVHRRRASRHAVRGGTRYPREPRAEPRCRAPP